MEMIKQKRNRKVSFFFFLFIMGFIIGVFIVFLFQTELIEHETFMRIGILEHLQIMEINSIKLLISCLISRMQFFLVLIIVSYTSLQMYVSGGCCVWLGFLAGMLLEVLSVRYGIKGIFLFIAGVAPQFFFYILAFILFIRFRFQGYNRYDNNRSYRKAGNMLKQIMEIVMILLLVLLGGVVESYVNPWMVEQVLKIF